MSTDLEFSCCFCGRSGRFEEELQLVVYEQREIESGDPEPESQSFYAHKACFERAVTPEHRIFLWGEDGEDEG
jgi:hypothetical protein